jgi:hypothetical protein
MRRSKLILVAVVAAIVASLGVSASGATSAVGGVTPSMKDGGTHWCC